MTTDDRFSGRLTQRQRDYAKLVAAGMEKDKSMLQVGYTKKHLPVTLLKLNSNHRVQALIKVYEEEPVSSEVIATKIDRQLFWTRIMNDPSYPVGQRIKASEMLGRSECDFIDRRQVETSEKKNPIVKMPSTSPEDWEKQWEEINDK